MNRIFYGMIAVAVLFAAFREGVWNQAHTATGAAVADQLASWVPTVAWAPPPPAVPPDPSAVAVPPPMEALTAGLFDAAKAAVTLAIGLVGAMAFFLGLMKVAEDSGMLAVMARALRPVMELLFPDVPADHPAMGAIIMNMSANALGLGNAATPFGIKAMQELDTLNQEKGTATNAMVLFLAINTSAVTLLPTGVIALRATMGSKDPSGILGTTLFATIFSTTAAILMAKGLQRFFPAPGAPAEKRPFDAGQAVVVAAYAAGLLGLVLLCLWLGSALSPWVVPAIVFGFLTWGVLAGVPVYESFVEGAKSGWDVAVRIIPYLVTILGAIGMLRGSGAIDVFVGLVGPLTARIGLPAEALPMALLRPLSGSGAYGVMTDILRNEGPDSYAGFLVSTFQGATETTFYVLAVYFGAVQVTRIRHAMVAAISADVVGILASIVAVQIYFAMSAP